MKLSILIPNRNEPKILEVLMQIDEHFPTAEVIVASDRDSRGKGWAVRTALQEASGDIICFLDGDMDIEPRMLFRLIPFIADYDIVIGKKDVQGPLSRRIITMLSRTFSSVMFGLNIDTQTGIKLFRRYALPDWSCDSFAFDMEILAKAKMYGERIIEVPIEITSRRPMSARPIIRSLVEALKVWLSLRTHGRR